MSEGVSKRIAIVGQRARGTPDFALNDLPSTSGRLDLLLRSARAALLVSHGVRRDVVVYLVLLGTPGAPRTLRIDGPTAAYLRPDERSLAVMAQKALSKPLPGRGFGEATRGVSVAGGGLEVVLEDAGAAPRYLLDPHGAVDVRAANITDGGLFVLGDHLGLDDDSRALLGAATTLSVGPVQVHADDAVAILSNELDRRATSVGGG